MTGTMDYTACALHEGWRIISECPHHVACTNKLLTMPQCFNCAHYRQRDTSCTIHGELPDNSGCCGLYVHARSEYCVHGWAHRRDWGLDCGWVDTIGCEMCITEDLAMRGEEKLI
jgi:hypothetical protein